MQDLQILGIWRDRERSSRDGLCVVNQNKKIYAYAQAAAGVGSVTSFVPWIGSSFRT